MDTEKINQAKTIVASEIKKIAANTPCNHGTLGAMKKLTKREAEAYNMALYFVTKVCRIEIGIPAINDDGKAVYSEAEREALNLVQVIADAAVEIAGK